MSQHHQRMLLKAFALIVFSALVGFGIGAGIWLLSQTTYDFGRSVGGWTLCVTAAVAAFVAVAVALEWDD